MPIEQQVEQNIESPYVRQLSDDELEELLSAPTNRVWNGLDPIRWIHNPVQSRRIWIGLDQKFANSADSGLD